MQNWERLYEYIHEYQELVLDYYSKHGVAFLTTYWNINKDTTVWDKEQMYAGAYEKTGKLSGMKWDKYLLLPVYFSEEISTAFDGSETGLIKEQETSIVFPSIYGITPYAGDVVKFESEFLQSENDTYPIFKITGVEPYPNTEKRYWKLHCKVYQSKSTDKMEAKTENTYVFFDYDKKIHTVEEAQTLARMLVKDEELKINLTDMWNDNSGLLET
jgi:hypothetical protein